MITAQISHAAFWAARIILMILCLLSVLVTAFFVERLLYFRKQLLKNLYPLLTTLEKARSKNEIIAILEGQRRAETALILKGLEADISTEDSFRKTVHAFLHPERKEWERFSVFLGSVGNNAPFIGLLGTVLGILKSFADLSVVTNGGPQVVMAGISEALIATAVGLLVAIPSVIFYNICKVRVKRSLNHVSALMDMIGAKKIFDK